LTRITAAMITLLALLALPVTAHSAGARAERSPGRQAAAQAARGSEPADTTVYMNPFEILVTASRVRIPLRQIPAATTVVGREQLQAMPRGVSLDEALKTVPGVRIDNQMDAERVHVSIRGQGILTEAGVRGIKVLLDGLPLNDPSGVAPDLYDVDWSNLQRVEVLRGPSGALYGGGGSGGAINITTNDGGEGILHGGVATTAGSYNFNKTTAVAGGTRDHTNYQVSFSRAAGDGYRVHTAFLARNIYEKVRWNPSPDVHLTQVTGWTDYRDQNAEGLSWAQVLQDPRQPNPDAGVYDEYYKVNRFYSGISGQLGINPHHDITCAGYFRMTRFGVSVPANVAHRSYLTPGLSLQYNSHFALGRLGAGRVMNHLSIGSDLQWQTFDEYKLAHPPGSMAEDTLQSNQRVRQRGAGVFVMDRVELGQQWALMLGGRYDDMQNALVDLWYSDPINVSGHADFHQATARAGLAYTPLTKLNLYANWAQGFLPPSTEELSKNPDAFGGFNRHLSPATSQGEEIGARGTLGDFFSYDLTGFHLKTDKDFDRYRISGREQETFYNNVGTSKRYGAEIQLRFHPVRHASAEVAYTYSHFKYSGGFSITGAPLDGKWLPNSPQHQLTTDLEFDPLRNLTVGVTCEVQTRWQVNSENTDNGIDRAGHPFYAPPVSGFTLWGARASYAWEIDGLHGDLDIIGRNIFGRKYIAFSEPDPDGNSYQPGPTAEVFGGISVHI
jgi:iron complex outermembrane recepter protein